MGPNDEDLRPWTIAVVAGVTVMALISVLLRLLARWEKRAPLMWDDWLIIFSMGWNIVVVGFIYGMVNYGMGLHADLVPTNHLIMIAKYLVVAEVLYVWNLVWTKLSLLYLYYRIFDLRSVKLAAYVISAFVIAWVITITFVFIFICVPVEKLWYPQLPGHCINQVGTWASNAASTILTDLAILALPLPQVWKLQLSKFQKVTLTIAFGLGFFVVFASIYRFTVLFSYTAADSSYTLAPVVAWTAIEMSAGITSANLPTLRPAVRYLASLVGLEGRFTNSLSRTRNRSQTGGANSLASGSRLRSFHRHGPNGKLSSHDGASSLDASGKAVDGFYRLNESGSTGKDQYDITLSKFDYGRSPRLDDLRPDLRGYGHSTMTSGGTDDQHGGNKTDSKLPRAIKEDTREIHDNEDRDSQGSGNSVDGDHRGRGIALGQDEDEVPLQAIRVQRDFQRYESKEMV